MKLNFDLVLTNVQGSLKNQIKHCFGGGYEGKRKNGGPYNVFYCKIQRERFSINFVGTYLHKFIIFKFLNNKK